MYNFYFDLFEFSKNNKKTTHFNIFSKSPMNSQKWDRYMQDKYANRAFLLYSCDTLVYNSNISVLC